MSFILDALRKSETDRQQQTGPGLADIQYRSLSTSKNFWIPLLAIVLAINAIVLAWVINSDSRDSDASGGLADQSIPSNSVESGETRSLSHEVIDSKNVTITAPVQTQVVTSSQSNPTPQQFGADTTINPGAGAAEAGAIREGLPSFQQLVLAGELSVQPMHLDIHVYSTAGSERFIFINMKKYQEGDNLAEGPSVEEITTTGVILNYRGKRFTLDRD